MTGHPPRPLNCARQGGGRAPTLPRPSRLLPGQLTLPGGTVVAQARHLDWIKSSLSYGHGECVELAPDGDMVALRDSKNPDQPYLRFTRSEMAAFLYGARRGEFDHLLR